METIFNIFILCNNQIIEKIGYRTHKTDGTDQDKLQYLLDNVESDSSKLSYINVSNSFKVSKKNSPYVNGISIDSFNSLVEEGSLTLFLEPIFEKFTVGDRPLFVTTFIVDGQIKIDGKVDTKNNPNQTLVNSLIEELPDDYIDKYMGKNGFELDKLLNDDFIKASKILFDNNFYVSSLKLILSAIDTMSYIEYGDENGNFKKWLNEYCLLEKLNLTSDEIWEFRNGLLHMTNNISRKVKKKNVKKLLFYVSEKDIQENKADYDTKLFNLKSLILCVIDGIKKWGLSYNKNPEKFEKFIKRYDEIISDSRYGKIHYRE